MSTSIPTYRLYREKSDESGDFWIHCETIPERTHLHNWEISQHRHDSLFQIFWLSTGSGEIDEAEQTRRFRAPCALYVPAGAVHGFRYSRDVDGLVVTALADRLRPVAASDRQVAAFAGEVRIVPLDAGDADAAFAVDCIARLHAEMHGRGVARLILLEPLVTGAIVGLVRASGHQRAAAAGMEDRDGLRIEALTTLVAAHFRERRPVGFYAASVGVSAAHLNRLARAATGFSVQGLIDLQIMEAARRDLVFTPTPVQGIAYALGFADPAYFSRFFRRQTGMTPGAFREAERRKLATAA